MRVITGSAKGRNLKWDRKDKKIRPLSEKAKSALFSIINTWIPNAYVLDLYAGSGALGIEALSRGAQQAVFVDIAKGAVRYIEENLYHVGFSENAMVYHMSAERFIDRAIRNPTASGFYDIIFIFPPYDETKNKIIEKAGKLLSPKGILIAEHHKRFVIKKGMQDLEYLDTRTYGITSLSFFVKEKAPIEDIPVEETDNTSEHAPV